MARAEESATGAAKVTTRAGLATIAPGGLAFAAPPGTIRWALPATTASTRPDPDPAGQPTAKALARWATAARELVTAELGALPIALPPTSRPAACAVAGLLTADLVAQHTAWLARRTPPRNVPPAAPTLLALRADVATLLGRLQASGAVAGGRLQALVAGLLGCAPAGVAAPLLVVDDPGSGVQLHLTDRLPAEAYRELVGLCLPVAPGGCWPEVLTWQTTIAADAVRDELPPAPLAGRWSGWVLTVLVVDTTRRPDVHLIQLNWDATRRTWALQLPGRWVHAEPTNSAAADGPHRRAGPAGGGAL